MTRELDLGELLAVLQRHGVTYVLVGGMAAVVHGSPFPTEDVDITPSRAQDNLQHLSEALVDLDARIRTAGVSEGLPFSHDVESLAAVETLNMTTRYGDLDLTFVPSGTHGYDDVRRDALATELFGIQVQVASLSTVVRSKQAANRPKDQRVLPTLRELLARTSQRRVIPPPRNS